MALKHSEFWSVDNVKTFRGFDVTNGEVELSSEEYGDYIDEIYEPVEVAGMTFNVSRILEELDPVVWRCGKGDYESELDSELQAAIDNEDDSEIEWIDDELAEDEGTWQEGWDARKNDEDYDPLQSDDWQDGWNDADVDCNDEERGEE